MLDYHCLLFDDKEKSNHDIIQDIEKPEGIAIDWLTEKIYQADAAKNQIGVANLDGSSKKILYQGYNHEQIRSVQVYPEKGYLFIINWGAHAKTQRCNLDGTGFTKLGCHCPLHLLSTICRRACTGLKWTPFLPFE